LSVDFNRAEKDIEVLFPFIPKYGFFRLPEVIEASSLSVSEKLLAEDNDAIESILKREKYAITAYAFTLEMTEFGREVQAAGGPSAYKALQAAKQAKEQEYLKKILINLDATTAAANKTVEHADETLELAKKAQESASISATQAKNSSNIGLLSIAVNFFLVFLAWALGKHC
jgi:hypothetical protein